MELEPFLLQALSCIILPKKNRKRHTYSTLPPTRRTVFLSTDHMAETGNRAAHRSPFRTIPSPRLHKSTELSCSSL